MLIPFFSNFFAPPSVPIFPFGRLPLYVLLEVNYMLIQFYECSSHFKALLTLEFYCIDGYIVE